MNKKFVEKLYNKVSKIRNFTLEFGVSFFGILGFIFGLFSLSYFFTLINLDADDQAWKVLEYSASGFGHWLGIVMVLTFFSLMLRAILLNPKNFAKKKN